MYRLMLRLCTLLLIAAQSVTALAHPGHAQAPTTPHRAVVNGRDIKEAVLHQNRLYVPAAAFAEAIGGTLTQDEAGTYVVKTAHDLPTLDQLKVLNPKLQHYTALSPYVPGMGIHYGAMGPSLILVAAKEGAVNAFEILSPAAAGWAPWFDQEEGKPADLHELGQMYTQHVYVTYREGLVEEGAGVPVILAGRFLASNYELKGHMRGNQLYIPLRTAVELLGGTIAWEQQSLTATAIVESSRLSYQWLKQLNPALNHYEQLSPFVPGMGFHHGAHGPSVIVLTDSRGFVTAFEMIVPAEAGWFPWFDQAEGQPANLHGMTVYTQHIYLVDPASIE